MARRTITFDGTSLQDSTYQVQEFLHESISGRDLNYQKLADRDGAKLVTDQYDVKKITFKGVVHGTDIDNLETNIDTLKELLTRKEKNLDIAYASGTRRYIASCSQFKLERAHYNITFAPFEAEFTVSNPPFGKGLDTSTAEYPNLMFASTATYEGTYTFTGTHAPMPIIKMTVNSEDNMNKVTFTNHETGHAISVETTFEDADVLIINTDDYTVTLNGVAIDYTGSIPEFVVGANDFNLAVRADEADITLKLIYYSLYL